MRCPPLIIHSYIFSIFSDQVHGSSGIFFGFFLIMQTLVISSAGPKDSGFGFFMGRGKAFGQQRLFHGDEKKPGNPECGRVSSSLLYMYIRTWASPVE